MDIYIVERRTGKHQWTIDSAWMLKENAIDRRDKIDKQQREGDNFIGVTLHTIRVEDTE